jgi:hypothetical protein
MSIIFSIERAYPKLEDMMMMMAIGSPLWWAKIKN